MRTTELDVALGDSIFIGDKVITATILDVRGGQVRIGVKADKNTPIHREEIYERIHGDNPNCKIATGTIHRIIHEKGFCFAKMPIRNCFHDVLIHRNALSECQLDELSVGDHVKFHLTKTEKGFRGQNVTIIDR